MREHPDIVLTDIIMPVLTGIELMESVKRSMPRIQFIILSGYNDFIYAQKAIQNEVKQYLLKPCDADSIKKSVQEAVFRIQAIESNERFINSIKENVEKLLPQAKEQFFRDLVQGLPYSHNLDSYRKLFQINDGPYRLLLFKTGEQDYMKLMTLKSLVEQNFGAENTAFCIIINTNVILLTPLTNFNRLTEFIEMVQSQCCSSFHIDVTVTVSSEGFFEDAPKLYMEVRDIIKFEFYLGEGRIITKDDVNVFRTDYAPDITTQTDELSAAIRSGNINLVKSIITDIFNSYRMNGFDIFRVRACGIELYILVIKHCEDCEISALIKNITKINECNTISEIKQFILDTAVKLARNTYESVISSHNKVIKKVIRYVQEHMDDENLTLQLIASEILYLNVDYLGKLFKNETGMKFSSYLLKVRMEKAKEMIRASTNDIKIYEVAQATGFSNNPSYFSQIFKKYTGYLPKDYRQKDN